MKTLIERLTEQTQSLKEQYLEMTKGWATEEYARLQQFVADYREGKYFDGGHYDKIQAMKKYHRLPSHIVRYDSTVEQHIDIALSKANQHYENSIVKLAARIQKKGLDESNLTMETSHIGVNIETILTDGQKTVRAFTIIAAGVVQKPHYRYLIK